MAAGTKGSQEAVRACIFCRASANSREDAWPVWLMELLQGAIQSNPRISSIAWQKNAESRLRQWSGKNARVKVRNVCRECNNGWMSGLEGNTGPILSPLILGHPSPLTFIEQLTVATWVVKTAMVFDGMQHGDDVFYTAHDRKHLHDELTAPESTFCVWLGAYAGSEFAAYTDGKTLRGNTRHALGGRPMKGHVQTMAFGGVVLQVLSLAVDASRGQIKVDACRGPWDAGGTIQIWPVMNLDSVISWPPSRIFDDAGCTLEAFADRFNSSRCASGIITLTRSGSTVVTL